MVQRETKEKNEGKLQKNENQERRVREGEDGH